jgi:3-(3-hydroxy-phenyl)propionate hydroxylase
MMMPGDDPQRFVEPAKLKTLLARWLPRDGVDIERAAMYMFHGLVATSWRVGRVLLAGDSAHQMPPFLGQGMNSGIRDAANLAWKLSLVTAGVAPLSLLDTYEAEREPHVRSIVEAAVAIGRIVCEQDPAELVRRDEALALRSPKLMSALAFRLPRLMPGPLVLDGGGEYSAQPVDACGRRFDDIIGPRFLVLLADGVCDDSGETDEVLRWRRDIGALVSSPGRHPAFADALNRMLERYHARVVVVRPDRYVMYSGASLEEAGTAADLLIGAQP